MGMENVKKLEKRIKLLEFRLGLLEKYIDEDEGIMLKHNTSLIDSFRINVRNDLRKSGIEIKEEDLRFGGKFYNDK